MTGGARRSYTRGLTGWLVGFGSSVLADQVFFLALTWAALQVGSPGQVGAVLAAGSVPRLLFLVIGGGVADRLSPKWVIISTDTARAVVMAVAATVTLLGSMRTVGLIVVAVAVGALDGLFLPAVGALPARIAPTHLLGRVAALRTLTQRAAMLLGGPLGGWLIYLNGPSAAFGGAATLFTLSVGSLALVPLVAGAQSVLKTSAAGEAAQAAAASASSRGVAATGLIGRVKRFLSNEVGDASAALRRDPVLKCILLLAAGMNVGFTGPVTAGLPMLAAANRWGPGGAGLLLGGFGLGAAAAGLSLVFVRRIPHAGWTVLAGVAAMGTALAAIGFVETFPVALAATVVLGVSSGVFGTVVHAIVMTRTPQAELGRVMALLSLSVEGVVPISYAATGVLAARFGVPATFLTGGCVILVTTALACSRRRLRSCQLTDPAAVEPADAPHPTTPSPNSSQG